VEHGPRGGDELNLIKENSNYGWPLATLGTRYNKLPVPTAETVGRHSGYDGPTFAWLPSIGVSNVTEIRNFDPTWDGDLLVASLSAQSLYRLRIADDNVRFAEQIRLDRRIRYAYQFNDRLFALLTDQNKLLLLRKTEKPPESLALDEIVGKMKLAEDRKSRLRTNLDACARCHSYSTSDNVRSPNLGNVFGRNIASTNFGHNSAALLNSPGTWDEPLLRRYLTDPQNFAYGTTMPDPNLSDDAISDLIEAMRLLHQPE
jgi:cytochrome c2